MASATIGTIREIDAAGQLVASNAGQRISIARTEHVGPYYDYYLGWVSGS